MNQNHFSTVAIWWLENGVVHLLFIDATPQNPGFDQKIQSKCPGGRSEDGETTVDTVLRELKQETGLSVKHRVKPISVYRPRRDKNGHLKEGFVIPRSGCRGTLRTATLIDGNSSLSRPYGISLDDALKKVFNTDRNKFHLNFLLGVHKYFAEKFGEEAVGPAKTLV